MNCLGLRYTDGRDVLSGQPAKLMSPSIGAEPRFLDSQHKKVVGFLDVEPGLVPETKGQLLARLRPHVETTICLLTN